MVALGVSHSELGVGRASVTDFGQSLFAFGWPPTKRWSYLCEKVLGTKPAARAPRCCHQPSGSTRLWPWSVRWWLSGRTLAVRGCCHNCQWRPLPRFGWHLMLGVKPSQSEGEAYLRLFQVGLMHSPVLAVGGVTRRPVALCQTSEPPAKGAVPGTAPLRECEYSVTVTEYQPYDAAYISVGWRRQPTAPLPGIDAGVGFSAVMESLCGGRYDNWQLSWLGNSHWTVQRSLGIVDLSFDTCHIQWLCLAFHGCKISSASSWSWSWFGPLMFLIPPNRAKPYPVLQWLPPDMSSCFY